MYLQQTIITAVKNIECEKKLGSSYDKVANKVFRVLFLLIKTFPIDDQRRWRIWESP
jgi:hypothetical protein